MGLGHEACHFRRVVKLRKRLKRVEVGIGGRIRASYGLPEYDSGQMGCGGRTRTRVEELHLGLQLGLGEQRSTELSISFGHETTTPTINDLIESAWFGYSVEVLRRNAMG